MGRLALVAWALHSQAEFIFDMTQEMLLEHGVQLIDDIGSSLYYLMTRIEDGCPTVDSFDAVPSYVGYGLHLIFSSIRDLSDSDRSSLPW